MKKSVEGIRIDPPVVEFHDVTPDVVYQIQLTVQNFGRTSRRIRFHQPTSAVSMIESESEMKLSVVEMYLKLRLFLQNVGMSIRKWDVSAKFLTKSKLGLLWWMFRFCKSSCNG